MPRSSAVEIENVVELMAWLAKRDLVIYPKRGRIGELHLVCIYRAEGEGEPFIGSGENWLDALRSAISKWEAAHGVEQIDAD